jgi:hypothetical protein
MCLPISLARIAHLAVISVNMKRDVIKNYFDTGKKEYYLLIYIFRVGTIGRGLYMIIKAYSCCYASSKEYSSNDAS